MNETERTPKLADLPVGKRMKASYRGKTYEAVVVEEDGKHALKVGDRMFKSLSAAGSSITGSACRGGVFFGLIQLPKPERKPKTEAEQEPQADQPTDQPADPPQAEVEAEEQPKADAEPEVEQPKPKSSPRAKRHGKAQAKAKTSKTK